MPCLSVKELRRHQLTTRGSSLRWSKRKVRAASLRKGRSKNLRYLLASNVCLGVWGLSAGCHSDARGTGQWHQLIKQL